MNTNKNESNDKLTDHEYDGIKECDNDLPKWWISIFYVTILFSVLYLGYYHWGGGGKSPVEEFEAEQQIAKYSTATASGTVGADLQDEKKLDEARNNKAIVAKGAEIFNLRCVSCHGTKAEGGIGPNLTDDYWIHGGKMVQIVKTIHDGIPEKGMIAWSVLLSNEDIISVAAYVKSLRGTNPPRAKGPQGNKESL